MDFIGLIAYQAGLAQTLRLLCTESIKHSQSLVLSNQSYSLGGGQMGIGGLKLDFLITSIYPFRTFTYENRDAVDCFEVERLYALAGLNMNRGMGETEGWENP